MVLERSKRHNRIMNWKRVAIGGAAAGAAATVGGIAVASSVAAYFARQIVTPVKSSPDDVTIVSVGVGMITLRATDDTTAPGRYGLWLDGGAGHARVGEIMSVNPDGDTVTRELLGIDRGKLTAGPARWNQYYYCGTPQTALGVPSRDVEIVSDVGPLPTWRVDSGSGRGETWAILIHGRGASREECLRAIPVLRSLGLTTLVPAYRNSREGPVSGAGRYRLGDTEWQDIDLVIKYALAQGAQRIVLVGWSMGGAIALQSVSMSSYAHRIESLVLNAPVVDWTSVLDHHVRLNKLPKPVGQLGVSMLGRHGPHRMVGMDTPIDLDRLDWLERADQLDIPMLILHSREDQTVPFAPSEQLAHARPSHVTLVPFDAFGHTREWNVDSETWEREVARFLLG